jgi:hypothetical protein
MAVSGVVAPLPLWTPHAVRRYFSGFLVGPLVCPPSAPPLHPGIPTPIPRILVIKTEEDLMDGAHIFMRMLGPSLTATAAQMTTSTTDRCHD